MKNNVMYASPGCLRRSQSTGGRRRMYRSALLESIDVWLVSSFSQISYNACRLGTKSRDVNVLHPSWHPRTSKLHDECRTKKGTANHDSVSPISQTSAHHIGDHLTTFVSMIHYRRHFGFVGLRDRLKWRRESYSTNVGSKWASLNGTTTSGSPTRPIIE